MSPVEEIGVYLDGPVDGVTLVGTLRPSFAGGRSLAGSSFQYDRDFLASAARYAISPDLPLRSTRTYTAENQTLFGAFEDASPDEWGEKIIEANHAVQRKGDETLPARLGQFDFLLGVSDFSRMGALRFRHGESATWLSSDSAVANIHDLPKVLAAAGRYEANRATDDDVAYLSDIATTPGGARPKANVELADNSLALAKLPHSKDGDIDVEGWEAVALTLAHNIGIRVAAHELMPAGPEKSVLVLRRFDRTADGRRIGYISGATAMGIGKHDDARRTYEEFADTIAELSASPALDLREMFARVALTVLINNSDDHWRNHGFLRDSKGWRLAPMFDVNPNPRLGSINSRPISADDDPRHRDVNNLYKIADSFSLSSADAANIIGAVAREIEKWPTIAEGLGLSSDQRTSMARAFDPSELTKAKQLAGR